MLNVLPLSTHIKHLPHEKTTDPNSLEGVEDPELKSVKEKFQDTQPTGCLLNLCKTLDQAKALLEFIDAIADKKLDRTVSLTAARGRGKSAALGVAIAAAVGFGYSNIFVTSPSPENLRTLFDFVFKAFDAMQYEEHTDYDLVQSTNPEFNQAVVRVNIHEEKNSKFINLRKWLPWIFFEISDFESFSRAPSCEFRPDFNTIDRPNLM